ncbi:monocarboxylate transporter 10-like [Actinia tenebrosa]|uniref:Monocarboxylate transporter 10-like n=1 Tax=Actinia tenebrosa TaxID=6105 RepID=A0A6P8I360_ACTTE|nr:monocarboxylate transporter 10-like [Actinia tenebrosa]
MVEKANGVGEISKRSWIVCGASFLVQFIVFGLQNSFGILFTPLLDAFHSDELRTAWLGTLAFTLMYFLGPIMTVLCQRFGCHSVALVGSCLASVSLLTSSFVTDFGLLFITYGICWGVGTSMCFYSSLVTLNNHFKRRLSLAYGLAMAGAGFGLPVISKLQSMIILKHGWRFSLRVFSSSGIVLFLCGCIFAIPTSSLPKGTKEPLGKKVVNVFTSRRSWYKRCLIFTRNGIKLFFDYELFTRSRALSVWTLSLSLILSGYFVPFVFLVRMASDVGIPQPQSALLIGYIAISQAISKIIFGQVGDVEATSRITILQIFALISAVNTTLCPLAYNYACFLVFVIVFGICDGCFAVMFSMGTHLIVGDKDMPRAFGNVCCIVALVQAVGTPLAGLIYDIFGEYSIAFFISGGLSTLGVSVMFLVPLLLNSRQQPQNIGPIRTEISCLQEQRTPLETSQV